MLDNEVYKLNSLPGVYVPNAIYLIKKDAESFDMYVANSSGTNVRKNATADDVLTTDNVKTVKNKTIRYNENDVIGFEPGITKSLGYLRWTNTGWAFIDMDFQPAKAVTGIVKSDGFTRSAAIEDVDYLKPNGNLSTPSAGNLSNCTADGTNKVAPANIPQVKREENYTLTLADAGKHILHPSNDATARTFTIPSNSTTPYPIGTALTFINQFGGGNITISVTADTMRIVKTGTTGSRILSANGIATAIKVGATEWIIYGVNLT